MHVESGIINIKELKKLNKDQFSDLSNRVLRAKERIENPQKLVEQNPLDGNWCKEEAHAVKEYGDLSRAKESLFKENSLVQQLNLGNYNTKLFFRAMKNHNWNTIPQRKRFRCSIDIEEKPT